MDSGQNRSDTKGKKMNTNRNEFDEEVEIDLLELFHVLLRKWWLIAICTIAGAGIAFGITVGVITPMYESNAMLYILSKTTSVTSLADIQIGSELTQDFTVIATSKPVIDAAIERIEKEEDITFTREEILDMVTVTNESNTRILTITATDANAEHACMVANAVATETADRMAEIMKSDPPTTVESAEVSPEPASPNILKNTVLGFLLGFVLICGILVVRHLLNDNVRTEEDVEKYLDLPVLATIPYIRERERRSGNKSQQLKRLSEESHE